MLFIMELNQDTDIKHNNMTIEIKTNEFLLKAITSFAIIYLAMSISYSFKSVNFVNPKYDTVVYFKKLNK